MLEQELKIRTENFKQQQATVTTKNNNKTVLMTNSLEQNEPQQTQHLSKQLNNRWLDGWIAIQMALFTVRFKFKKLGQECLIPAVIA